MHPVLSEVQDTFVLVSLAAELSSTVCTRQRVQSRRYIENKARDYDRWVRGMRKLHNVFGKATMQMPPFGFPAPKL